jgi:hypothetical protein
MEEQLIQLIGNYGVLGFACYLGIKEFFNWLGKRNGNGNGVEKQLQTIGGNHLTHIQKAIEDQTKENNDWHRKQFEILCEINANLKSLK